MADRASSSITIRAPRSAVLEVIADFEAYPEWAGQVKTAEVLSRDADGRAAEVRMVLDAGLVRDDYVLAYDWDGEDAVSWRLVRGQVMKAQDGSYRLHESSDGSTEVRYDLSVELTIPLPGLVRRRAEGMIMNAALAGLKKRVEALAG